jgi:steroid 5-alpha reductase family enzyme
VSVVALVALAAGAFLALALIMAGAFLVQRRTGNSGWIDTTWSLGVGVVATVAALLPLDASAPHWRQLVVAGFAAAWSFRLGLHIAARTRKASDDPRYRALIEQWGDEAPRQLFLFLQAQAAVGVVLVLAVALAAHNPNPAFRLFDLAGILVLALAVAGEALADEQLRRFRADPANRGGICDVGLWSLSRHPNYFFEWLTWTAYPLFAIDLAGFNMFGVVALVAPAVMYAVLVHGSGVPPLEAHMLRTRGDAFRAYQARTRTFFPFPRRQRTK